MRTTRLLDRKEDGTEEYYHFDPLTNGFVVETRQDISGILELNKTIANDNTGKWGEFTHVAHIPLTIVMELAKQGIMTPAGRILDDKKYRAWLNDPSNSHFRVKHGRV